MKSFIITVDTEGDNLWDWQEGAPITTENVHYIPRFQELCEKYGLKPVYLTNYEMAQNTEWVKYGKYKAMQGLCEIGMHIHAWNSPPEYFLENKYGGNPYITEYPDYMIHEKLTWITRYLQSQFEMPMRSARSGRWATNDVYFSSLKDNGYVGDCSMTPGIDLSVIPGHSANVGNDYRRAPYSIHMLPSGIVEVPMTTRHIRHVAKGSLRHKLGSLIKGDRLWLRPYKKSLYDLQFLSEAVQREGESYLEFMIHSAELMPGGSPYFKTEADIELLYSIMDTYFRQIVSAGYTGVTLSDYICAWRAGKKAR